MKYSVKYMINRVPSVLIVIAKNKEDVEKWFKKNRSEAVLCSINIARPNDIQPATFCIEIS